MKTEAQKEYHRKYMAKYALTPNIKEQRKRYSKTWRRSLASQVSQKKYHSSERCKLYQKNWNASAEGRYSHYRSSAKSRGIDFTLTIEEFKIFWQKACEYCGDSIETISLDRIDSSKGYTLGNVVPCCSVCNFMKLDHTKEFWVNHMKKVIARCLS